MTFFHVFVGIMSVLITYTVRDFFEWYVFSFIISEAEYAFALQKPIIPLLMEKNYKPDGWLGILKGSKLFFDFSGKYPYEKKLEDLIKELGPKGRSGSFEVNVFS